jgi:hypothetical protein
MQILGQLFCLFRSIFTHSIDAQTIIFFFFQNFVFVNWNRAPAQRGKSARQDKMAGKYDRLSQTLRQNDRMAETPPYVR